MEPHSFRNPKAITHASKILLNLLAHAVLPTPVRIQRETVRVEMARNITTTPGIRVREPCAADVVRLLHQLEVLDAELAHDLHGEAEARHAGADDEDFDVEGHGSGRNGDVMSWEGCAGSTAQNVEAALVVKRDRNMLVCGEEDRVLLIFIPSCVCCKCHAFATSTPAATIVASGSSSPSGSHSARRGSIISLNDPFGARKYAKRGERANEGATDVCSPRGHVWGLHMVTRV